VTSDKRNDIERLGDRVIESLNRSEHGFNGPITQWPDGSIRLSRVTRSKRPQTYKTGLRYPLLPLCLCASVVIACASKPATFFPNSNEVPGWNRSGDVRTFEADKLWEYIDGDAEKYIQAGVQKTVTADYRYRDVSDAVADVYIMSAPDGAQKIFESESAEGSQPVQIGDRGRLYKGSLIFRKGRYFVRLVAYQDAPDMGDALAALGRALGRKL